MAYLCSYLPQSILSFVVDREQIQPPQQDSYETVVLFADVSGFTAMCEAMAATGPGGDEYLAKNLNSYFELLVRAMASQGGDVFKFAGDAILVVWPPTENTDLSELTRRAAQCGLEIGETLQDAVLSHNVRLSVKVGIGAGRVTILHLGGEYKRLEYLAVGDPLIQAFHAEHQATKREVVVSPEAWKLIEKFFDADVKESGHAFISNCRDKLRKANIHKNAEHHKNLSDSVLRNVASYIPTAIVPFASQNDDKWISELRHITVLFVNLGVTEEELVNISTDEDIRRIDTVLRSVQKAVYQYEGSLNKFLMDDKGSTLIAIFGLPPLAHEDDAIRGVLSALSICDALHQLDLRPSIGITTGTAFCGVVGSSRGRREYSVLGDTVNLSARLMQHATKSGAGVLVDSATHVAALEHSSYWHQLSFFAIDEIQVKGKTKPIEIWQPVVKKQNPPHLLNNLMQKKLKKGVEGPSYADLEGDPEFMSKQEMLLSEITKHIDVCLEGNRPEKRTIVVESDAGLGKSTLLLTSLRKLAENPIYRQYQSGQYNVVFGAGNKFDIFTPLRCWRDVILRLFDDLAIKDPRVWVRQAMLKKLGSDELAPVLNEVFEWQFEVNERLEGMDKDQRLRQAEVVVVALLGALSEMREGSQVVAIEDGTFLDLSSWSVALSVSQMVPKVMLIMLTRPMEKTMMAAFTPVNQIPPAPYKQLKNEPQTELMVLRPRSDQVILKLANKIAGSNDMREDLAAFILSKSTGNPWVAQEFVLKQLSDGLLVSDGSPPTSTVAGSHNSKHGHFLFPGGGSSPGHSPPSSAKPSVSGTFVTCEPNAKLAKIIEGSRKPYQAVPRADRIVLPNSIQSVNGGRLDRLSPFHVMILKVAAVLGDEFDAGLMRSTLADLKGDSGGRLSLFDASPSLASKGLPKDGQPVSGSGSYPAAGSSSASSSSSQLNLEKELGTLLTLRILRKLKDTTTDKAGSTSFSARYCFTSGVMRDVILSRMLDGHQVALINKIRAHSDQYKLLMQDPTTSMPEDDKGDKAFVDSLMEGYLKKQGAKLKNWKARYFVLWHGKLTYYKNKGDANSKGPKGEIIIAKSCMVESDQNSTNFLITPALGSQDKREFQAPSKADAQRWVEEIRKLARRMDQEERAIVTGERRAHGGRHSEIVTSVGPGPGKKLFEESVKEGYLVKRGDAVKTSKRRYFVLFNDKMLYFLNQTVKNVKGEIPIGKDATVERVDSAAVGASFYLCASLGARKYLITAENEEEANEWMDVIQQVAARQIDGSNQFKMANHSVKEGFLRKKGGTLGNWKLRYFVLYNNKLQYFDKRGETNVMTGEFDLWKETQIEMDTADGEGLVSTFFIRPTPQSKTYVLEAKDGKEALSWVAAMRTQRDQTARRWQVHRSHSATISKQRH